MKLLDYLSEVGMPARGVPTPDKYADLLKGWTPLIMVHHKTTGDAAWLYKHPVEDTYRLIVRYGHELLNFAGTSWTLIEVYERNFGLPYQVLCGDQWPAILTYWAGIAGWSKSYEWQFESLPDAIEAGDYLLDTLAPVIPVSIYIPARMWEIELEKVAPFMKIEKQGRKLLVSGYRVMLSWKYDWIALRAVRAIGS